MVLAWKIYKNNLKAEPKFEGNKLMNNQYLYELWKCGDRSNNLLVIVVHTLRLISHPICRGWATILHGPSHWFEAREVFLWFYAAE